MSLDTRSIQKRIVSHAAASGHFDRVDAHEPKSAPGRGITAAVWIQHVGRAISRSGLATTSARLTFNVRVYTNMLAKPEDMIDPNLVKAVDALLNAYSSDFSLGGTVAQVDLLGAYGEPLEAEAGYLEQDHQMMRVMTINLPLIVNDVWEQVP